MSTKERYGNAVWDAVCELSHLVMENVYCFVSVGEVAKKAGVSRMTARKYLEIAKEQGHLSSLDFGKTRAYRLLIVDRD